MSNVFSSNVNSIEISGIRKFFNKVSDVPGAISLTLGQPDFSVPKNIKNAMIEAIVENKTEYTANAGIPQLRNEISNFLGEAIPSPIFKSLAFFQPSLVKNTCSPVILQIP